MRDEQVLSRHGGAQANGRGAAAQSRLRMRNAGGRSEPFTWAISWPGRRTSAAPSRIVGPIWPSGFCPAAGYQASSLWWFA